MADDEWLLRLITGSNDFEIEHLEVIKLTRRESIAIDISEFQILLF